MEFTMPTNSVSTSTSIAFAAAMERKYFFKKSEEAGKRNDQDFPGEIMFSHTRSGGKETVFEYNGAIVDVYAGSSSADIDVYSESEEKTKEVTLYIKTEFFEEPPVVDDHTVKSYFWYMGGSGPSYQVKYLQVAPWDELQPNYGVKVRDNISQLISLDEPPEKGSGRMIILHGPPGTGKTNLIRSIASNWRDWAEINVILDPEKMLSAPQYLMSACGNSSDGKVPVIIMEDAGELVSEGSKQRNGQMISRLLNMADGLATQWSDALFLITTNEPIGELNAALTRAGRCLASVEVGHLSAEEASEWLGEPIDKPTVLADLYASKNARGVIKHRVEASTENTGMYM